jgi:hypothetical protein
MTPPVQSDANAAKQTTIVLVVIAVLLNVAFFFLSSRYYADKVASYGPAGYGDAELAHTRLTFALFTGVTVAVASAAAFQAWYGGFIISFLAGAAALVAGGGAIAGHLHPILAATLFVVGTVFLLLGYVAAAYRSRAAWAFLVGLNMMSVATTLFGATKIRNALGTGLWTALIVPGLFCVAALSLISVRTAFDEETAPVLKLNPPNRVGIQIIGGLALIAIGVLVTAFTYLGASASPTGGHYVIASGPVVVGIGMLARGLIRR